MTTDAKIDDTKGYWDFEFDDSGQIETTESFDTSILRSLHGEVRALQDEVIEPQLRRGWIGNDDDFENGSKLWLYSQSRLTRSVLNSLGDEAKIALDWLVSDGYAASIDNVVVSVSGGRVLLSATIRYTNNISGNIYLPLWTNTGV